MTATYKLGITATGKNGETVESTIEVEAESKEDAKETYLDATGRIVEYWDIDIEHVNKMRYS